VTARYEDTAPRLAGEATQGRWEADGSQQVHVMGTNEAGEPIYAECIMHGWNEPTAQLVAYHHPARVVALAAVVARLRERADEGHTTECLKRFRPRTMPCTCGHEDDVEALRRLDEEA
jgi:hypothetical protein